MEVGLPDYNDDDDDNHPHSKHYHSLSLERVEENIIFSDKSFSVFVYAVGRVHRDSRIPARRVWGD